MKGFAVGNWSRGGISSEQTLRQGVNNRLTLATHGDPLRPAETLQYRLHIKLDSVNCGAETFAAIPCSQAPGPHSNGAIDRMQSGLVKPLNVKCTASLRTGLKWKVSR